jgi:GTP-binding nuclear protein Ran
MFNLLIVGDNKVGKTAFITKHKTGEFVTSYIAANLVENTITLNTSEGKIDLNTWEISQFESLEFTNDIHMAIIMFDLTELKTYEHVFEWHENIRKTYKNIPIVLCGNKVDIGTDAVKSKDILDLAKKLDVQYYYLSSKNNSNFEKPFLHLLKKSLGNDKLTLTNMPKQEVRFNNELEVKNNNELEVKNNMNLLGDMNPVNNMINTLNFLMSENLRANMDLLGIQNIETVDIAGVNRSTITFKFEGKKYRITAVRDEA